MSNPYIFVSHASDDEVIVFKIVEILRNIFGPHNIEIKDQRDLPAGRPFRGSVPAFVAGADKVLVIWSAASASSDRVYVHDEAQMAIEAGKYIPLIIDRSLAQRELPYGFRQYTTGRLMADISNVGAVESVVAKIFGLRSREGFPGCYVIPKEPEITGWKSFEGTLPTVVTDQPYFVGRTAELGRLYDAWDGNTRVLVIVAGGGCGKTALVNRFLETLRDTGWRGAERVFVWSFYRQGTDVNPRGSADQFFASALRFFGYNRKALPRDPQELGRELARLIAEQRSLVVLDGLEPLQYPAPTLHSPHAGKLKHEGLKVLFAQLRTRNPGLCIVTTRFRVPNLREGFSHVSVPELSELTMDDAIELLRKCGVQGTEEQLASIAKRYECHALSIGIMGNVVREHLGGDGRRVDEVDKWLVSRNEDALGSVAWRVMRSYEIAYEQQLAELTRPGSNSLLHFAAGKQLYLLRLMGLFSGQIPSSRLLLIARSNNPPLAFSDVRVPAEDWEKAIQRLASHRLIYVVPRKGMVILDAHPLVRQYLAQRLRQPEFREAAIGAHRTLYGHLLGEGLKGRPDGQIDAVSSAIEHACLGGLYDEAFRLYEERFILRNEEGSAGLGAGSFGQELDVLRNFFVAEWTEVVPAIHERQQAILVNSAAYNLQATADLVEAASAYRSAAELFTKTEQADEAAVNKYHESECQLFLGKLSGAAAAVNEAAANGFGSGAEGAAWQHRSRVQAAYLRMLQGDVAGAIDGFRELESEGVAFGRDTLPVTGGSAFKYMDYLGITGQRDKARTLVESLRAQREKRSSSLNLAFEYLAGSNYLAAGEEYHEALRAADRAAEALVSNDLTYPLPMVNLRRALLTRRLGDLEKARTYLVLARDAAEFRCMRFIELQCESETTKLQLGTGEISIEGALERSIELKQKLHIEGCERLIWDEMLFELSLKAKLSAPCDDVVQYFKALGQLGAPYYEGVGSKVLEGNVDGVIV